MMMTDIVEEMKMDAEGRRPIEVFQSQTELNECLRWWQDKLCMNDWIISAAIVPVSEMDDKDDQGENHMIHTRKVAEIRILKKEDMPEDSTARKFLRHCDEQILVHELLHCLYDWMDPGINATYEGVYIDEIEHQKLDQLAKSMIMVKYNLPLSYFAKPID